MAQQSFTKVWKSFPGGITKTATNSAIGFLRVRRVSEPLEDIIPAESSTIDEDLDIRSIVQCTESTVRNLLSQAKDSFRRKAKELFPDYGL